MYYLVLFGISLFVNTRDVEDFFNFTRYEGVVPVCFALHGMELPPKKRIELKTEDRMVLEKCLKRKIKDFMASEQKLSLEEQNRILSESAANLEKKFNLRSSDPIQIYSMKRVCNPYVTAGDALVGEEDLKKQLAIIQALNNK